LWSLRAGNMFGLWLEQNTREEMIRFRLLGCQQEAVKHLALLFQLGIARGRSGMQFTRTDFRSFLRQLWWPRLFDECEQCRQLPHCDVDVKALTKRCLLICKRRRQRRNVDVEGLLEFEDVPIEGEDLSRAGMTLGKVGSPLDAFVRVSFGHCRNGNDIAPAESLRSDNGGSFRLYGTRVHLLPFPALKRWAKLFRPLRGCFLCDSFDCRKPNMALQRRPCNPTLHAQRAAEAARLRQVDNATKTM
jgi:hypothetical protein